MKTTRWISLYMVVVMLIAVQASHVQASPASDAADSARRASERQSQMRQSQMLSDQRQAAAREQQRLSEQRLSEQRLSTARDQQRQSEVQKSRQRVNELSQSAPSPTTTQSGLRAPVARTVYNDQETQALWKKILSDKPFAKGSRSDSLAQITFQNNCLNLSSNVLAAIPQHVKRLGRPVGDALEECVDPILTREQIPVITGALAEFWLFALSSNPSDHRALWWLFVGEYVYGKVPADDEARFEEIQRNVGRAGSEKLRRDAIVWAKSR